jgi:homoserine O-acetyltransferase
MIVAHASTDIGQLSLVGGQTLAGVQLGYETYGRLSATRDNAVLVCHPFPGNAHAAGRRAASDAQPGFWDALIGPGKAIDTDRWWVICVDGLSNLNGRDGITTAPGPGSDRTFPPIAIRDLVESQRALLARFGVLRLRAVAGPSMGAMQALEWAAAYPDAVGAVIAALPVAVTDPYTALMIARWSAPIRTALEQKARDGELDRALVESFAILSVDAQGRGDLARRYFGQTETALFDLAAEARLRAARCDPLAFLILAEALRTFSFGHGMRPTESFDRIAAPVLLVPAQSDELFPPSIAEEIAVQLRARGKAVELFQIPGDGGHRDGVGEAAVRMSAAVTAVLETCS